MPTGTKTLSRGIGQSSDDGVVHPGQLAQDFQLPDGVGFVPVYEFEALAQRAPVFLVRDGLQLLVGLMQRRQSFF